jgi:hypothetical protein
VAYDERAAEGLVESAERTGQVGATHRAGRFPERRVDDEQRHDAVGLARGEERRVVREPEVAPEPHHRGAGHRHTVPGRANR